MSATKEKVINLIFRPDSRGDLLPHFEEQSDLKFTYNIIEGRLVNAFLESNEKGSNNFIICLEDDKYNELLVVTLTPCDATYSIISSLAGIRVHNDLKIVVRKKNNNGYILTQADVYQNRLRIPWRVDLGAIDPATYKQEFFESVFINSVIPLLS